MNLLELVAKIRLDSSEYDAGMQNVQNTAQNAAGNMDKSLATAQKNIQTGMLAMTGAGVAALGAFAASSVKTGAEFDSSMSQVAATMGKTMEELSNDVGTVDTAFGTFSGNLREYAQYMGKNTAFSAKEAAEALNYMALAGYDTQTSMEMLPNVLNLAAAGGIDLASASDMVTDAQTALGLSTEQTNTLVDQMAQTASKSNTSVAQLGDAILTIGATARNVAGGTTELNTVLGVLADNGIKGAEGGTHLRNVIVSLQTPTKAGTEALEKMGMTYDDMYDSAGNLRSLPEIFQQISGSMEGMNQQQKDAIVGGLFNKADLASVNALLGTSADRWDELTGEIDNAAGAAQKMADTQLDNLEGDVTLFKSALESLKIEISDGLAPSLRKLVQFATQAIQTFNTWAPIVAGLATAFGVFAVAINMTAIITKVTMAFKALFLVLTGNPIGLIVAAIAGLIVYIVSLYKTNEDFRNKVNAIFDSIKKAVGGFIDAFKKAFSTIVEFGGKIRDTIGKTGDAIKEKLGGLAKSALQWGKDLIKNFIDGIKQRISDIGKVFSGVAGTIRRYIHFSEPDVGPLSDFSTYAPDMMKTFAQGIKDNEHLITDQLEKSLNFAPQFSTGSTQHVANSMPMQVEEKHPITIVLELDKQILGKAVYDLNKQEEQRHGVTLVLG